MPDDYDMALWQAEWSQRTQRLLARKRLRERLASEQNHRCCYCGVRTNEWQPHLSNAMEPTLEHVVPRHYGGLDIYEHCAMACRQCNAERGSDFLEIHYELLEVLRGNDTGGS